MSATRMGPEQVLLSFEELSGGLVQRRDQARPDHADAIDTTNSILDRMADVLAAEPTGQPGLGSDLPERVTHERGQELPGSGDGPDQAGAHGLIGLHVTAHAKLDELKDRQGYIKAKVNAIEYRLKTLVNRLGMILEEGLLHPA